jgi:hypothetical protein
MMRRTLRTAATLVGIAAFTLCTAHSAAAQHWIQQDDEARTNKSMFRPLEDWPAPNEYRTGGGMPGAEYWQQKVDYVIETSLDTVNHRVSGTERITYHNYSPDHLPYLWVQLDQNVRSIEHSRSYQTRRALPENFAEMPERVRQWIGGEPFDGGHDIMRVQLVDRAETGATGGGAIGSGTLADADYRINNTIMRVNLTEPLEPGGVQELEIDWAFNVPDAGRGAKEQVSDGWIYEIAQWFPRLSVYDDVNGWQTDQFMGRGEFYLEFGDYDVKVSVPSNHILEATGVLQNPEDVLTDEQIDRLERAYTSETPVFIVGPDEVMTAESRPAQEGMLTWHFKADDVRDFAWASSKTYVWDAAGYSYPGDDRVIAAHSMYPRDAMPLWDDISTISTIQTLKTYGEMAFEYPYPKASNVNGPAGGMEYPMLAFCGARPRPPRDDASAAEIEQGYSDGVKWALVSVTIHEVGHNWFPMIVDSDERKWTWMDEGLNTFLQHYAEIELFPEFPGWWGSPPNIREYMRDLDQVPIMTHSDLIHKDFTNNGYAKPASGLTMLREVILGPEVFDEAFSGYAQAWMFKKPQPSDFFRSMDEGAGEDLSWMWRGWFYTTHYNDQALGNVERQDTEELLGSTERGQYYYRIEIENKGGLVMPIRMNVAFEDGTEEFIQLPADVWRMNEKQFVYGLYAHDDVISITLDPDHMLADIDDDNNVWMAPAS